MEYPGFSISIPSDSNYVVYDKYNQYPASSLTSELLRATEAVEVVNLPNCGSSGQKRLSIDDEVDSIDEVRTLTSEDLNNLTHELSNYFDEVPSHESKSFTEASQINEAYFTEPCSSSFYSQLSSVSDTTPDNAADKLEEIEVKFRSEEYRGRVITGPIAEHVGKLCVQQPRIRIYEIQNELLNKFGEDGKVSKNNLARFITRHGLRDSVACRIKLDKEMEAALVKWRREDDSMSAVRLKQRLEETFPDRPKISTNRIYYLLRSYGIGKYVSGQEQQVAEEPSEQEPLSEEKLKSMRFTGYVIDQEIGQYIGQMCLNEPDLTYKEMSEKLVTKFGYRATISSHGLSVFIKRHGLKTQHTEQVQALENEVQQAILELRRQNPYITWQEIKNRVNAQFEGRRKVNNAYVGRVMSNHGYKKLLKREKKQEVRQKKLWEKYEQKMKLQARARMLRQTAKQEEEVRLQKQQQEATKKAQNKSQSHVPSKKSDQKPMKQTKQPQKKMMIVKEGECVTINAAFHKKAFPCTLCDCAHSLECS